LALVIQEDIPFAHPTETDAAGRPARFVLRLPLKTKNYERMAKDSADHPFAMNVDLVASAIVGWPYDVPITREAVSDLDGDTIMWLVAEVKKASNLTDDEKNASSSSSLPTTESGEELSQPSLGT
jgi:hypothetical protein